MTEDAANELDPTTELAEEEKRVACSGWDGCDLQLTKLVRIVNKFDHLGISITLAVSGQVVTGLMIPVKKWRARTVEALVDQLSWQWRGGAPRDELHEVVDNRIVFPDPELVQPKFVHLAAANYVTPSGFIPPAEGMLWRGAISRVDGWHLGSIITLEH